MYRDHTISSYRRGTASAREGRKLDETIERLAAVIITVSQEQKKEHNSQKVWCDGTGGIATCNVSVTEVLVLYCTVETGGKQIGLASGLAWSRDSPKKFCA